VKEIRLVLEVLTPMFLGGADPSQAELREPSVRGQLRFWWRAQQAALAVDQLWRKEAEVFGTAGEKENRRSSFSVVLEGENITYKSPPLPQDSKLKVQVQRSSGARVSVNLLEYLAYGASRRKYIAPGSRFSMVLRFRDPGKIDEVLKALRVFCLFGGIGAKVRNGYGSFEVVSVKGVEGISVGGVPDKEVMQELCKANWVPPFSTFCRSARLFRTRECYQSWEDCLAALAMAWRDARLSLEGRSVYNSRQYLGAPIVVAKKTVSFMDRRAKPYFLRVHREGDGYRGCILYLPSQYLPPQYHKRIGIKEERYPQPCERENHENRFSEVCNQVNERLSKNGQLEVVF
jgi:CRISPR-associated protein Cmr1